MMTQIVTWFRKEIVLILVFSIIALALFINLEYVPPLWWDEGWTLSVARNWVELGHYGRLLDGQPYTAGLAGHFPLVALVALSFKLFGIGAWQGRLPCAILSLGALGFLFFLASRLYNRKIAYGALFLLLFTNSVKSLHPIIMGRQVMGELPALFFLLAGATFLLWALDKSYWWILPAMIFWGIAIRLKAQEPFFWMISLVVPLIASLLKHWWKESILLVVCLAGTWLLSSYGFVRVQTALIAGHYLAEEPLQGSFGIVAFVPVLSVRLGALRIVLASCILALLGIGWVSWKSIRAFDREGLNPAYEIVRWMLLVFSGGWFIWYLSLSISFERYAHQPNFIGSIFGSAMLYDLTRGFDLRFVMGQVGTLLCPHPIRSWRAQPLLGKLGYIALICWIVVSILLSIFVCIDKLMPRQLVSAKQVGIYLNTNTTPGSKIETYESEVHFYLNAIYHYPPDQVSLEFTRRKYIDPSTPIDYDALESDPDYLVIGNWARKIYTPWIESGDFQLIKEFPCYEIYERVRP